MKQIYLIIILIYLSFNFSFSQKVEILENPDNIKITEIKILNSKSRETNLSISPDGKYIYYMSDRGGMPWSSKYGTYKGKPRFDGDIWYSVKKNNVWQKPNCLHNSVNTYSGEDEPNISPDGQFVTYQSWNTYWKSKGGPYYTAILQGGNWSQPVGMGGGLAQFFRDEFSKYYGYATDGMTLSPDKKSFIVASGAEYDGNLDLYLSKKVNDEWQYCEKLSISTENDERSAFIAGDGKTLFFASDGYGGKGGLDIFKTTLNKDGTFGEIYNIGEPFNTEKDDYGFILTASGREAYFVREGDIYYADLSEASEKLKPDPTIIISGKVTDCDNKAVETFVNLYDTDKNIIVSTSKSGVDGNFSFVFLEQTANYKIVSNDNNKTNIDTSFYIEKTGKYLEIVVNIDACEIVETKTPITKKQEISLAINFDFDKDNVKEELFEEINNFIKKIKDVGEYKVEIIGHTDNKGNDLYNEDLGMRRATNVKKYFINKGVENEKIKIFTKGEKKNIADNNTEIGAYKNRRVVVKLIY